MGEIGAREIGAKERTTSQFAAYERLVFQQEVREVTAVHHAVIKLHIKKSFALTEVHTHEFASFERDFVYTGSCEIRRNKRTSFKRHFLQDLTREILCCTSRKPRTEDLSPECGDEWCLGP